MSRKILKHSGQVFIALLAGLSLVMLVFAWKLSQGPISVPQLTPYLLDAVAHNARGMQVRIKDTIISWEGWERTIDVSVLEAKVFTRDGRILASVPRASVSLSAQALIDGVFAPSSIELISPQVYLLRRGDGTFSFELGAGMDVRADRAIDLSTLIPKVPDETQPLSYLEKITVRDADFEFEDKSTGLMVVAPKTTLALERIGETLIFDSKLDALFDDRHAKVDVNAGYNLTTEILDLSVRLDKVYPSDVALLHTSLEELKAFNFPLQGEVKLAMSQHKEIRSVYVDLSATGGEISLPAPVEQTQDLDTFVLKAGYENFNSKVQIEEAMVALKPGAHIDLNPIADHLMPIEVLRLKGAYDLDKDQLDLENVNVELGGRPEANIKASIQGVLVSGHRKVDLVGEVVNVPPTDLYRYWPKGLNDDARDWVVSKLSDGIVHRAGINLSLELTEEDEVILHRVDGDMEMDGVTVNYLAPMPVVRNAQGWAKFDRQSFRITVTGGGVEDIQIKKAQIDIVGLDEYDQRLNLNLVADGPLRKTLEFIDNEPLGFATALGVQPKNTSGHAQTNLELSFLLIKNLTWDGVEVSATAKGSGIEIRDVIFDQNLTKGDIGLRVNKKGMDVEGKIVLGSIPADLKWRENFTRNTLFKRRFLLDGVVNDQQRVNELKLNFPPFTQGIMNGPLHVDATITEDWDGVGAIETFTDLEGASIDVPVLKWSKSKETAGQAYVKVLYAKDRLLGVPYFSVSSEGLRASGSLALDPAGKSLQLIRISRFQAGRTDVTGGTVLYSDQLGWEVDVHGNSLDLSAAIHDLRVDKPRDENKQGNSANKDTNLVGTFSGRFNKVWLDEQHSLNTVAGAVSSDGKIWTGTHLTGVVGGGKPFLIDLSPEGENRRLKMETDDAGALLRALDVFDDMQGGKLVIDGTMNDQIANRPLVGNIMVDGYRITKVPVLAKLLSLIALTGVVDSLQGDGIGFTQLIAPFKLEDGVLEFKDGRTNGISMGLTWQGKIDTDSNVADLNGTIVPAYGINSLLGNIPVIGQIFGGTEKGGGLFAWTYNIKGDLKDAEVNVNPVSALAPGFLRNIFKEGAGSSEPSTN